MLFSPCFFTKTEFKMAEEFREMKALVENRKSSRLDNKETQKLMNKRPEDDIQY